MKRSISIHLDNDQRIVCPPQTLVGELLAEPVDPATGLTYLGALVNNELVTFGYALDIDSSVRFVTMASPGGMQIYVRSLSFLLAKAVKDLHPTAHFSVEHALGPGLGALVRRPGVGRRIARVARHLAHRGVHLLHGGGRLGHAVAL